MTGFCVRVAIEADVPGVAALMERSIAALQAGFLTPEQIVASRAVMGLDTQLVRDRTYFVVEEDGVLVGCGGGAGGRPCMAAIIAARCGTLRCSIRRATRRGYGRCIRIPIMPGGDRTDGDGPVRAGGGGGRICVHRTDGDDGSGVPLYRACSYASVEPVSVDAGGVTVPMVRMAKMLIPA